MNDSTLNEVLKVNFLRFSKEEIENIMEEELEKAPEEMDTELIDMCLDILMGEPNEKADEDLAASPAVSDKKAKRINFKKGILVAAIITLLLSIAIPVSANVFNIDVPENILKIYEEFFKIDFEGGKQSEKLDDLLAENDLQHLVLPQFLFAQCEISEFEKIENDFTTRAHFNFTDKENNTSGRVTLASLVNKMDFLNGEMLFNGLYEEVKQLTVNGIDVVFFSENNNCFIIYYINELEYSIVLNGVTFDKAVEIASTL
jgi:hypothetical protein